MKGTVSRIIVTLMLAGLFLALASNIKPVKASETIYIRADGSVDPSAVNITRIGDVYIFTGSVDASVVVERSDIVIDGGGNTLHGSRYGNGIELSGINNVMIRNVEVVYARAGGAMLSDGRFVKLNKFANRLNTQDLRYYCWKLKPLHVYFSVLNWLFPEQVGKKYKARYCVPLNGEFVIDVDSYLMPFRHDHVLNPEWQVCQECLGMSRRLALQACEAVENYYSKIAIVLSGRLGFHVHVLDFHYRDWASYREKDPIWCHQLGRFKSTRLLQKQTFAFDRQ